MEAVVYLDTHVVAWLYAGRTDLLGPGARAVLGTHALRISPMVSLELKYLFEIGRVAAGPDVVLPVLYQSLGLVVCDHGFAEVARQAWATNWTRDPFDRLITAQASLGGDLLVTKDSHIWAPTPRPCGIESTAIAPRTVSAGFHPPQRTSNALR